MAMLNGFSAIAYGNIAKFGNQQMPLLPTSGISIDYIINEADEWNKWNCTMKT